MRKIRVSVRALVVGVFLVSFALLLPGVAPHITSGDAGELALAGETLGVAHSPGYPVFTVVNYVTSRFLFFGNMAYQQNLISCLLLSLTIALLGMLCALVTTRRETVFIPLLLLAAPRFRELAWTTEVFSLTVFWATLVYLALMRFHKHRTGVYLVSFLMGVGIGVHQTLVLVMPAILLFLVWNRPKALGALWRDIGPIAGFFLLGLTVHLYLPFRSFAEPVLDWEDPETIRRFWGVVTRERYGFFQLTQGENDSMTFLGLWKAIRHARNVFVLNIGWIGMGLVLLGTLASLARRVHRRWMVVLWMHVILTGPVFFWLAKADPRTAGGLLERFSALPLMGAIVLVAVATASILDSGLRLYRGFLALALIVFIGERVIAHPFASRPLSEHAMTDSRHHRSLRWDASVRESAINMLRMTPAKALFFSDRADETEFSLAFLLHAEGRRPDVRFVDCNAGVTRSIYGEDYYRIWGKPRLALRESVEKKMLEGHPDPVVYATLDPTMIDIYRTQRGLLFRAWALNRVQDPSFVPWAAVTSWRNVPSEIRGAAFARTNLDLLGQASFERGHKDWAEKCFGLSQLLGGGSRFEKMGYWNQTRGDVSEARRWYQKAMAAGVISEALFVNRGALEMDAGRVTEAHAIYEQGLRAFPRSTGLLYNTAVAHWHRGEKDRARAVLMRVIGIDPKHAAAQRMLLQLGNSGDAF